MHSKCRLEIDLGKIQQNYRTLQGLCSPKTLVGAAIKANAYGLGAKHVAPALSNVGCTNFFVARLDEGLELRQLDLIPDANIFVLDGVSSPAEAEILLHHNLLPVLNHLGQVQIWHDLATQLQKRLPCALHINTGMHRLAMPLAEFKQLTAQTETLAALDIKYILSHLAASEDLSTDYNKKQLNLFKECLQDFPYVKASLANSAGIFLGTEYHFDLVRPGIALYGVNPTPYQPSPVQSVIRLKAPIIQLQSVPASCSVGYNMTYTTMRDSIIATLPIGYADGYPRQLSNKGFVVIGGHKAPIAGRVSMDLVTVDVTDIPSSAIFLGQYAEIIGDSCTTQQVAESSATIGYEILTQLGSRYNRIYL